MHFVGTEAQKQVMLHRVSLHRDGISPTPSMSTWQQLSITETFRLGKTFKSPTCRRSYCQPWRQQPAWLCPLSSSFVSTSIHGMCFVFEGDKTEPMLAGQMPAPTAEIAGQNQPWVTSSRPTNLSRVGATRTGPGSFQRCPATGQGATGTKCKTGTSIGM